MKKIFCIGFLLLLVLSLASAQTHIPAPFSKAKEIALSSPKDLEIDCRVWRAEISKDGEKIQYIIIFSENHRIIIDQIAMVKKIGNILESVGSEYNDGTYYKYSSRNKILIKIAEKEAVELGFKFFRELVENNLI